MNLVEKLLAVDNIDKRTKYIKSDRLSKAIGCDAEVKIQEISGRKFNAVRERLSGAGDANYESNLLCCVYGIVEPDLRNAQLQEHFGAHTPKDLCEKLFQAEVYRIAGEIIDLSGLTSDEDDVKN